MNQQSATCNAAVNRRIGDSRGHVQTLLAYERMRCQGLQADLPESRVELLQIRADLLGPQVSERPVRFMVMHIAKRHHSGFAFFDEQAARRACESVSA